MGASSTPIVYTHGLHYLPPAFRVADSSLFKEEETYREEVVTAVAQLDKLRDEGADGADIRNAVSVIVVREGSERSAEKARMSGRQGRRQLNGGRGGTSCFANGARTSKG